MFGRGSLEAKIQGLVHAVEQGIFTGWIKLIVVVTVLSAIALLQIFLNFKGLSEPEAMEHAEIARELASGNWFSTKSIRPLAMWQLRSNGREIPRVNFPETYHAPLSPMVSSIPLFLNKDKWAMTTQDVVYDLDRIIAAVCIVFFFLSLFVWYFVARKLFDKRLAIIGTGLLLVTNIFWEYALSGLPQMLLLFLFSCAVFALVQAVYAQSSGGSVGIWLSLYGIFGGLMALGNAMTIWIFAGGMIFVVVYFRPRLLSAILPGAFFLLVFAPWLVRNFTVTGNPLGLGWYALLDGVGGSETLWMRTLEPDFSGVNLRTFLGKMQDNVVYQTANLVELFGWSLLVPLFFVSLVYLFKQPERSNFRWCILVMWAMAFAGMTVFGPGEDAVAAAQLHVLFIPIMVFYGLAFFLVLWSRLPIDYRIVRVSMFTMLYLVTILPLALDLLPINRNRLHWPPYVPPFIAILGQWTQPNEIISSDIPWAVAWYANRKCIWLPNRVQTFIEVNDYQQLGGQIVALYLTPVTGHMPFFSEIVKGEYREWAPFILRSPNLEGFPLSTATALPIENECILYADRQRWSTGETDADTAKLTGEAPAEEEEEKAEEGEAGE